MAIVGGAALLLLVVAPAVDLKDRIVSVLAKFIPSVEGFKSTPYWDENRYSWGYGTRAPGASGTITREQAFNEMVAYLLSDYRYLSPKISRSLTVNQWAALLSFSYNLGNDDAVDLVPLINAGNTAALGYEWGRYVHSGGVRNPVLVARRQKEWALWNS